MCACKQGAPTDERLEAALGGPAFCDDPASKGAKYSSTAGCLKIFVYQRFTKITLDQTHPHGALSRVRGGCCDSTDPSKIEVLRTLVEAAQHGKQHPAQITAQSDSAMVALAGRMRVALTSAADEDSDSDPLATQRMWNELGYERTRHLLVELFHEDAATRALRRRQRAVASATS